MVGHQSQMFSQEMEHAPIVGWQMLVDADEKLGDDLLDEKRSVSESFSGFHNNIFS